MKNDTLRKHKTSNRNLSNELYKEASVSSDIKRIRCKIQELPSELTKNIDIFIADLKQPKYEKPLIVYQLASLLQSFYTEFKAAEYQYLTNLSDDSTTTFINTEETFYTGLIGIFAGNRSSNITNNANKDWKKGLMSLFCGSSFTTSNSDIPLSSSGGITQE